MDILPNGEIYPTTFANCQTMAITLNQNTDCCETSCTNSTVNVAGPTGPAGAAGAAGAAGSDGANAYTTTSSSATIPAALSSVSLAVYNASPYISGQAVYIQGAGYFEVVSTAALSLLVKNLGYVGNAVSGTLASGSKITPSGTQGLDGSAGITYPAGFAGKGDLLTLNGPLTYSAQAIGSADTNALFTDSTAPNGMAWRRPLFTDFDHASAPLALDTVTTSGQLPLASLGGGAAAGQMAYWNGTSWEEVPVGGDGYLLSYDLGNNKPAWVASGAAVGVVAMGVVNTTGSTSSKTATVSGGVNVGTASTSVVTVLVVTLPFNASVGSGQLSVSLTQAAADNSVNPHPYVSSITTTGGANGYGQLQVTTQLVAADVDFHFVVFNNS